MSSYPKKYQCLILDCQDMDILKDFLKHFTKEPLEANDAKRILKTLKEQTGKKTIHKSKALEALRNI